MFHPPSRTYPELLHDSRAYPLYWDVTRFPREEYDAEIDWWEMWASTHLLQFQIQSFVREFGPSTVSQGDPVWNHERQLFQHYSITAGNLQVKSVTRLDERNLKNNRFVVRVPGVLVGERMVNGLTSMCSPLILGSSLLYGPIFRQYRSEYRDPVYDTSRSSMALFTAMGVTEAGEPLPYKPLAFQTSTGVTWQATQQHQQLRHGQWRVSFPNDATGVQVFIEFGPRLSSRQAFAPKQRHGGITVPLRHV